MAAGHGRPPSATVEANAAQQAHVMKRGRRRGGWLRISSPCQAHRKADPPYDRTAPDLSTRQALCPPKPNVLTIATLISVGRALRGMQSRRQAGSWWSRFAVGGSVPWRMARTVAAAPMAPAAPSMCPVTDFVELSGMGEARP